MAKEKIYVNGALEAKESQYGTFYAISVDPVQLQELLDEYNKKRKREGVDPVKYIKINAFEKRDGGYYLVQNDEIYKPDNDNNKKRGDYGKKEPQKAKGSNGDLPF